MNSLRKKESERERENLQMAEEEWWELELVRKWVEEEEEEREDERVVVCIAVETWK